MERRKKPLLQYIRPEPVYRDRYWLVRVIGLGVWAVGTIILMVYATYSLLIKG
ncbi:MAG: hypothetical protein GWN64_07770 [Candidatus Thorarchaeota archaeon]|nr:hypothetical protein [Candidatus Thorarchaeota archaeon]